MDSAFTSAAAASSNDDSGGDGSSHGEESLHQLKKFQPVDDEDGGRGDEGVGFHPARAPAACQEEKSLEDCYEEIGRGKAGGTGTKGSEAEVEFSSLCLVRAPSLPPDIGRVGVSREGGVRTNMLIRRQVSSDLSDLQSSRHSSKGMLQRDPCDRYRHLKPMKPGKSLRDLEHEEVQGFKDLGFSFEDEDSNRKLLGLLPGLQEKGIENPERDNNGTLRPYLSEAWIGRQQALPPIPKWDADVSPDDMKAQIKHWARAVASNARE